MLEFFYDVLLKYFDPALFNLVVTDTDSLYLALAGDTLNHCLRPETRDEYLRNVEKKWFVLDPVADKRTPSLLKVENALSHMVCLCSKTYAGYDERAPSTKPVEICKAKGTQKRNSDIMHYQNLKALYLQQAGGNSVAYNMGFTVFDNSVYTYLNEKQGLSIVFVKRHTLRSGHTAPLDM